MNTDVEQEEQTFDLPQQKQENNIFKEYLANKILFKNWRCDQNNINTVALKKWRWILAKKKSINCNASIKLLISPIASSNAELVEM